MKEDRKYIKIMKRLLEGSSTRYAKYERNLRAYSCSPKVSLDNPNSVEGYFNPGTYGGSATSIIQQNVIYSCISTLVSKIASQKARPFINTIKGNFHDIQIAKAAQQYFDLIYDDLNIYKTVSMCFRDACIFDTGVIFIDRNNKIVERVYPWTVYLDPSESQYNKQTHVLWKRVSYPTTLLPDDIENKDNKQYITWNRYYSIKDHVVVDYIPELDYYKEESWEPKILPFLFIHYETPQHGLSSQSVVDLLYGIQAEIDKILMKIEAATTSTPLNIICAPEDSTIKSDKLTNEIGQFVTYTQTPNMTGSPISVVTPAFIDPQCISWLEQLKSDAYELVGISELSAMSKKPSGIDSGVALQTLENVESDRFQTQLNQILVLYTNIAKAMIDLYPENEDILPQIKERANIKWSDILKIKDKMTIQFSAADSLSKDPSTKLQQLQMLAQSGILPANRIASLMNMPDLELGYSFADNSLNAIQSVIQDCIENDDYEVPPYISIEELKPEIINTCLQLKAANEKDNQKDIDKLLKLYSQLINTSETIGNAAKSDEASEYLDNESNNMTYRAQQMDMQSQQMNSIMEDLQNGQIDKETAQQMMNSFQSMGLSLSGD